MEERNTELIGIKSLLILCSKEERDSIPEEENSEDVAQRFLDNGVDLEQ